MVLKKKKTLVIIIFTSQKAGYWWLKHIVFTDKAHAIVGGNCYTFLWNGWTTNLCETEFKQRFHFKWNTK